MKKTFVSTFWAAFLAFFAANIALSVLVFLMLMGTVVSSLLGSSSAVSVEDNSILKIDLGQAVTERGKTSPLGDFDLGLVKIQQETSLLDFVAAIDNAAVDERISGIYLDVPLSVNIPLAYLEEIRSALLRFKNSGKFIASYSEMYPQAGYYLASVADSIFVNPQGGVSWQGMASNVMFMKGLLDKLDIEAQVIRHGQFKSAIEPYILSEMSPENRMQYTVMLESLWGTVVGDVAASLGVDSVDLVAYANELKTQDAKGALECGMVSSLRYYDQVEESLSLMASSEDEPEYVSMSDYLVDLSSSKDESSDNKVALIYADGAIISGSSDQENVGSLTLAEQLTTAREDDDVKAVVLRVNSPGGSALASEVMWREIELVREVKPVVVSMGSYAASGGYYISCPADIIVANRTTITGSIGVYGVVFNAGEGLKNKLGITFDGVKTSTSADMGSIFRPLSKAEHAVMLKGVEDVYTTFVQRVSDGRNLSVGDVDKIGGGRVWSGASAIDIGLIDGFGGIAEALVLAADRAGIASDYRVVDVTEKDPFDVFMESLMSGVRVKIFGAPQVSELNEQRERLERILKFEGIQALSPWVEIEM